MSEPAPRRRPSMDDIRATPIQTVTGFGWLLVLWVRLAVVAAWHALRGRRSA